MVTKFTGLLLSNVNVNFSRKCYILVAKKRKVEDATWKILIDEFLHQKMN